MGSGGNAAGSGATQAGAVAAPTGRSSLRQADRSAGPPAARAPEAARQHCPFSIRKSLQRATNRRGERYRPSAGKPCPSAWKALWALSRRRHVYAAKCPSTRHYLRATSDNRRSVRRTGARVTACAEPKRGVLSLRLSGRIGILQPLLAGGPGLELAVGQQN